MRNRFFGSLTILVSAAGLVLSDEPGSSGNSPTPPAVRYGSISHTGDQPRSSGPAPASRADADIAVQSPPLSENDAAPSGYGGARFWGRAEFLLWSIKDGNIPPLVTTGPPASVGIPGAPGTTVLSGDGLDYDHLPGARFTVGAWFDRDCAKGIELSYFFLSGGDQSIGANSSGSAGSAVLSRPFFNVNSGLPDVQVVAFPGVARGRIRATLNGENSDSKHDKLNSKNRTLQGAELNLLCNLCCEPLHSHSFRLDLLAGPRWLQFNEDLVIAEQVTVPTATFTIVDRFETRNTFYGGQIGARAEWQRGCWFVNLLGKVAVGTTHQEVRISGATVINQAGAAPIVRQGGLLALPTNIGTYSRNTFSVVPEIGVNVGCQLTGHLRVFAGYTYLWWSNVVRPGDQIDLVLNPTQLPSAEGPGTLVGPARPAFAFRDTNFWAQGISVGLEFGW